MLQKSNKPVRKPIAAPGMTPTAKQTKPLHPVRDLMMSGTPSIPTGIIGVIVMSVRSTA